MKLYPNDILTNETIIFMLGERIERCRTKTDVIFFEKVVERLQQQEKMIDVLMDTLEGKDG